MDLKTQKLNLKLPPTPMYCSPARLSGATLAYEKAVLTYSEESARLQYECGLNLSSTTSPGAGKTGAGK
jgi:hypothetical protein